MKSVLNKELKFNMDERKHIIEAAVLDYTAYFIMFYTDIFGMKGVRKFKNYIPKKHIKIIKGIRDINNMLPLTKNKKLITQIKKASLFEYACCLFFVFQKYYNRDSIDEDIYTEILRTISTFIFDYFKLEHTMENASLIHNRVTYYDNIIREGGLDAAFERFSFRFAELLLDEDNILTEDEISKKPLILLDIMDKMDITIYFTAGFQSILQNWRKDKFSGKTNY